MKRPAQDYHEALGREDWALAEDLLRKVLEQEPGAAPARAQLAAVLYLQGHFEEAYTCFRKVPDKELLPAFYSAMAECAHRLGRNAEALELLTRALTFDLNREEVHCNLAALLSDSDPKRARMHFRKAIDVDAMDPTPLRGLAKLARDGGDNHRALEYAEEATRVGPDDALAWQLLGELQYSLLACRSDGLSPTDRADKIESASSALRRAIRLDSSCPWPCLYLGLLLHHFSDGGQAERWFVQACRLGDSGIFGAMLGEFLADVGRYEEADAGLTQTIEDYPDCAEPLREYGRSLIRCDRADSDALRPKALALFERAVLLDDQSPANLFSLGCALTYDDDCDLTRARALLEKSLRLRPDHKGTLEVLRDIQRTLGEG